MVQAEGRAKGEDWGRGREGRHGGEEEGKEEKVTDPAPASPQPAHHTPHTHTAPRRVLALGRLIPRSPKEVRIQAGFRN